MFLSTLTYRTEAIGAKRRGKSRTPLGHNIAKFSVPSQTGSALGLEALFIDSRFVPLCVKALETKLGVAGVDEGCD